MGSDGHVDVHLVSYVHERHENIHGVLFQEDALYIFENCMVTIGGIEYYLIYWSTGANTVEMVFEDGAEERVSETLDGYEMQTTTVWT